MGGDGGRELLLARPPQARRLGLVFGARLARVAQQALPQRRQLGLVLTAHLGELQLEGAPLGAAAAAQRRARAAVGEVLRACFAHPRELRPAAARRRRQRRRRAAGGDRRRRRAEAAGREHLRVAHPRARRAERRLRWRGRHRRRRRCARARRARLAVARGGWQRAAARLHLLEHRAHRRLVDAVARHRGEQVMQQPLQLAVVRVLADEAADARHRLGQVAEEEGGALLADGHGGRDCGVHSRVCAEGDGRMPTRFSRFSRRATT